MIEFFLARRQLTNLLTLFLVVVGGWQVWHLKRDAFPDVEFDILTVTTVLPGASPEEVETLLTHPIEDELRGVGHVDKVESYSLEGRSLIVIWLDENLSRRHVDRAVNDIQQAVQRAQGLPPEAERPLVQELHEDRPLLVVSVAGGTDDARDRFADELADALEDIPAVSRVSQEGDRDREIWIEADRRKLEAYRLTPAEIAAAVRARNVDVSAGSVEQGPEERWVRVVGTAKTAAETGEIILRGSDARSYLRVRDVAEVRETFAAARLRRRAAGRPAIQLGVRKQRSGDSIQMADAVRALLREFAPRARALGIELVVSDDFSFFIKRRLRVMTSNFYQGGLLILAALFLFLDWRLALVAAAGVPISFAAAFLVAVPLGFSLNLLTLIGLILVLGMLDDDSVVVAENIYRHLEMGKPPLRAAAEGAREVVLPVLGSVATACCAFLPFALMTGILGKFLFMIPVVVVMAFLASAFEAFFILPAHVIDLLPYGRPVEQALEGRWYHGAVRLYRLAMGWVLRHRWRFLLLAVAAVSATAALAWWRVRFILFPPGLIDQVFIQIQMPRGTGLTETERAVREVERIVAALPPAELEAMTGMVGAKGQEHEVRLGTHYGQVNLYLTPEEKRPRRTREIKEFLRARLAAVRGPERIVFEERRPGPPVGRAILARVRGRDPKVLERIAEELKAALSGMDGVTDIRDSNEGGKEQLRIRLDPREGAYAGLDVARVAQNVLFAVDGGEAARVRRPDEEITVKVRLRPEQRARGSDLLGLRVLNAQGRPVVLGEVASIQRSTGPAYLARYNFKPMVVVSADVDTARITSREANRRIQRRFADVPRRHPGYDIIYGGEEEETQKSLRSLLRAFAVALLLDFVILSALFRSYVQPFIILLTVPIGLLGVAYALLSHGQPATFMALLGAVAMTGVVVNNAIVLLDFINRRRREGAGAAQAAVDAGAVRLRPIWASSLTTLLGLFPTAYGWGGHEPFVAPMALAMAWGLTFAMPLTLFLIPTAYVLVDDLAAWWQRKTQPWQEACRRAAGARPPQS